MLAVENLFFGFTTPLLEGVSFRVSEAEIVALIGLSGSGKTTLFGLITGLLKPLSGAIRLRGGFTYMQQEDLLLPWRSVEQNIMLPFELGRGPPPSKNELHKLLSLVGLLGYEEAFPDELSGGMRQKVALARALLQNQPLLLLDEPFGALDVLIKEQLYLLLKQIRERYRKTILLITHDFHDALELADRILVLSKGQICKEYLTKNHSAEELKKSIKQTLGALV